MIATNDKCPYCDPQGLEKLVNEFIADKHVINIKFKINDYPDYLAFVIYEENNVRIKKIK